MSDETIGSVAAPLPLDYDRSSLHRRRPWGQGFLALCASFVFWGLGHWMAGAWRRGLVWFLIWLGISSSALAAICVPRLLPALIVILPLQFLLALIVWVDAFRIGRRSTLPMLGQVWLRYLAGIGCLVLAWAWSLGVGTLIKSEVAEAFIVPTRSMMPTIHPRDRIVAYKHFTIHRWDLVVVHPPERPDLLFTERVAGLPGETIEIVAGNVHVNGRPIPAPPGPTPYVGVLKIADQGPGCTGHPITLGEDEYYLLGDNSPIAGDARYWRVAVPGHQLGAAPLESIAGRVGAIYWPPIRWRTFP